LLFVLAFLFLLHFAAAETTPDIAPAPGAIRLGVHDSSEGRLGAPAEGSVLDEYAEMTGRTPEIVMDYSSPTEPLLTPIEISNLEARHETPLVTWQFFKSGWSGPPMGLQEIAEGRYDSSFTEAAELAKELPFEVMIRPGHEMNGNWYPWAGEPQAFVAAWRHIVDLFRQEGVDNVKWIWSPEVNHGNFPFDQYYPGDQYVDYVGLDGYNWGTNKGRGTHWETLSEVFGPSYRDITFLSSRPVILSEVGSGEEGGNKAQWIREGLLHTVPVEFPRVAAVIWFDYDKEEDWRVNSSPASLSAFREVVASPLYGGAGN
jgi:hypothetical protein